MSLPSKSAEIHRLIKAFELEASKFPDLQLHTFFITQQGSNFDRPFISPNHAMMLWQYYGNLGVEGDVERLVENLETSDLKWGLRGAALSMFAVLEGVTCDLFVRMATRA